MTVAARSTQLINPQLHRLLNRNVPGGVLRVMHAGVPLQGYHRRPIFGLREGPKAAKPRFKKTVAGEEYILNCPFCNDTRGRLTVNNSYGVPDENGDKRLWLANCYNEACLEDESRRQQFYLMVYTSPAQRLRSARLRAPAQTRTKPVDIREPGDIVLLEELLETQPNHPAVQYVLERDFDPVVLSRRWGIGYCSKSRFDLARDRLYIPVMMDDKLVGWQTRLLHQWVKGMPPKYWSCPGQQRAKIMYNFDTAHHYFTVVLVEGPADTWRVGGPGIGLLGKTVGTEALPRLVSTCGEGSCAILLDPVQDPKAKAKGRPHHIETAYLQLRGKFRHGVAKVYLPETLDPGSADHDYLWDLIHAVGKEQDVKISFKKVR